MDALKALKAIAAQPVRHEDDQITSFIAARAEHYRRFPGMTKTEVQHRIMQDFKAQF